MHETRKPDSYFFLILRLYTFYTITGTLLHYQIENNLKTNAGKTFQMVGWILLFNACQLFQCL